MAPEEVLAEIPLRTSIAAFLQRVWQTIRTELAPTASMLHNSLRVRLGLALALQIAELFQLNHAFWVVLGKLPVLRSNALTTSRKTLQALGGFVIGALFLLV